MGFLIAVAAIYLILTLFLTYLLHQIPRRPVRDEPDWGHVKDIQIPAVDGGNLETWVVEPDIPSKGTVLLAHGWSRNRDRMMGRARIFGKLGFKTVLHSARDHGNSTPNRSMNAFRFAQDIEAILNWLNEPVLLYGHSMGAAGAILAASRHPDRIRLLFLEGCYARTKEGLRSLYRSVNPVFGLVFGPMIVLWMDIYYRFQMNAISPELLAGTIPVPVLLIHGEKDQSFPLHHAWRLRDAFPGGGAELFVAKGSNHSNSSLDPRYAEAIESFILRHLKDP
ncbi:MAG: alpha/beta fold hydrolase [Deltaproteobacteria bacterium]|nr:alpha/beta fold hydrolase [Deltaproteobacteria bacterium]